MSIDDYNRGRMDQQIQSGDSVFSPSPRTVVEEVRNYEEERKLRQSAMDLIIALKKSTQATEEWKTYAKRLESIVEGAWAIRDALRDEINHCPNHSAHPIGLNKDAQIKLSDAAYIKEARKNNLPESDWNENVRERNK